MRLPRLSKLEWIVIAVVAAALVALLTPSPHYRETRSESCHLCGNCRVIVGEYRWWRLSSERTEAVVSLPVAEGHAHDWWTYGSSHVSHGWHGPRWAASKGSRYRDGRQTWTP